MEREESRWWWRSPSTPPHQKPRWKQETWEKVLKRYQEQRQELLLGQGVPRPPRYPLSWGSVPWCDNVDAEVGEISRLTSPLRFRRFGERSSPWRASPRRDAARLAGTHADPQRTENAAGWWRSFWTSSKGDDLFFWYGASRLLVCERSCGQPFLPTHRRLLLFLVWLPTSAAVRGQEDEESSWWYRCKSPFLLRDFAALLSLSMWKER